MNKIFMISAGGVVLLIGIIWLAGQKPEEKITPTVQAMPTITLQPTTQPTMATIKDITELKTEDIKIGDGEAVKPGDTVVMHYTGTLLDGTKFDSSLDRGQPFTTQIGVGRVIEGWDKGVPGMKVGGKRMLYIPSEMGYGSRGAGGAIPPNADLIFEVELMKIIS